MINLDANNRLARWFVWSCDHLPMTVGQYTENDELRSRTGSHYIENGTTLCHVFWVVLWLPLLGVAAGAFFLSMIVMIHVEGHYAFIHDNPSYGPVASVASYFIPELIVLAMALVFAILVLAIIGGSKTGFFALLWQYLKGIKERICPLVRFGTPEGGA